MSDYHQPHVEIVMLTSGAFCLIVSRKAPTRQCKKTDIGRGVLPFVALYFSLASPWAYEISLTCLLVKEVIFLSQKHQQMLQCYASFKPTSSPAQLTQNA